MSCFSHVYTLHLMSIYCSDAGASRVGDNERRCIFPEGKRICTLQGNSFSSTYQPNTQLRERARADCMNQEASSFSWFSSADLQHAKVYGYPSPILLWSLWDCSIRNYYFWWPRVRFSWSYLGIFITMRWLLHLTFKCLFTITYHRHL